MTVMYRSQVNWAGFPGAPGYTFLFATTTDPLQAGADAQGTAVQTMISHWKNALPGGVSVTVDPSVHLIEDTTGDLVDILTLGFTPSPQLSGNSGGWSAVSGMCIDWLTSTVVAGKRRQGRSFIVPVYGGAYDASGTILDSLLSEERAAATTYIGTSGVHPVVWSRPVKAKPAHVPPIAARAGVSIAITAARMPDKAVILRSRRPRS